MKLKRFTEKLILDPIPISKKISPLLRRLGRFQLTSTYTSFGVVALLPMKFDVFDKS